MNVISYGGLWLSLLLLSISLTVWVHRVALSYGQAFSAGAVADWRMLVQAIVRGSDFRYAAVDYGVSHVVLAVLMFSCAVALYRIQLTITGVALLQYGFVWVLALMAQIDRRTGLLIDALNYPLIGIGLVAMLAGWTVPWQDGLLAAVVVGGFLVLSRYLASRLRGSEALGLGDIKMFIAIGLWIGLQGVLTVLLLANLLFLTYAAVRHLRGSVIQKSQAAYPFGPFVWAGVVLFYMLLPVV